MGSRIEQWQIYHRKDTFRTHFYESAMQLIDSIGHGFRHASMDVK